MSARKIDLDAARAARAESEPVTVVFGGEEFTLPPELPLEAATAAGEPTRFIEVMFGDQHEAFMQLRPSMNDVMTLANGIAAAYGFASVGESVASGN
jgi:hypothetical protein